MPPVKRKPMVEMLKPFGYVSFFELYQQLVENGLAGEKEIKMAKIKDSAKRRVPVRPEDWEEIYIEVEYIKARAFDEIYPKLPTLQEAMLVRDIQGQLQRFNFQGLDFFDRVLALPTRNNPNRQGPPAT
jgi:hypothetical protein